MSVALVTEDTHPATRALLAVLERLEEAGIAATRDPGAFYPQPIGTLVALPALVGRGMASRTFEVGIKVVSGDPLSTPLAVDRLYALADDVAGVLAIDAYEPDSYRSSNNAEPLPALALTATLTVTEEVV